MADSVRLGQKVHLSELALTNGERIKFASGQVWLLLVFYPGDFTPVCTQQWCHYRDHLKSLQNLPLKVVGVSDGPAQRHQDFARSYQLPFDFVDDAHGQVIQTFGMRNAFGFVKRGLALIDPQGILRYCKSRTLPLWYPTTQEIVSIFNIRFSENLG